MWAKHKQQSGFTIVELLIVIVVIAILAAISIVAYNGIQQRSNNSKTITAVQAYTKLLQQYYVDNSDYPDTVSCLGVGYSAGVCRSDNYASENQNGFNTTALAPYLKGSAPTPALKQVTYSNGLTITGAFYVYKNVSYNPNGAGFGVIFLGSSPCPAIGGLYLSSSTDTTDGQGKLCRYGIN